MENELFLDDIKCVNSMELLARFTHDSKKGLQDSELPSFLVNSVDLITAVYYFRIYPNVNDFINRFLSNNKDYFLLQWVRNTWDKLSGMTQEEISNSVITQVEIVNDYQAN